jgi:hypothetical protein
MATSSELIKRWLEYAKQNNIKAGKFDGRPAEDSDLKAFLISADIDRTVVNNIVGDIGLQEPEKKAERKLSDQEVRQLNSAKQTVKSLSAKQKKQLYRELKDD